MTLVQFVPLTKVVGGYYQYMVELVKTPTVGILARFCGLYVFAAEIDGGLLIKNAILYLRSILEAFVSTNRSAIESAAGRTHFAISVDSHPQYKPHHRKGMH